MFRIINLLLVHILDLIGAIKINLYEILFSKRLVIGANVKFNGPFSFRVWGSLNISEKCIFNGSSKYNMAGIFKKNTIFIAEGAKVKIGANSGFSGISIYCKNEILIGENCKFGVNTCIWDTDFHPLDYLERRVDNPEYIISKKITIGNDVFVGANCVILKGVEIGERSIIAAGSVVTKNIPPNEIWGGNPIKLIRKISE